MEPVIYEKKNYTQLIITLVLAVGLITLIGGYIYYGMQTAIVSEETTVTETPVSDTPQAETPKVLTDQERQAILNDLAKTGTSSQPVTAAERDTILNALSKEQQSATAAPLSDEEKAKIMSDLEKPTSVTIHADTYPEYTDVAPNP